MPQQTLFQRLHLDFPLLLGICILCGIGLIVLYSASGQDIGIVYKQLVKILIAIICMCIVAQFSPGEIARWSIFIYVSSVILLVVVIFAGDIGKGAQRWLDLQLFRFQPSELIKLSVPMIIAWHLRDRSFPPNFSGLFVSSLLIIIPVLLIVRQPDLGTAFLVAASGFSALFIAGMSWKLLMSLGVVMASSAPILWYVMHDYQRRRVITFLNPEQDPLGAGYHIIQSKIAIGSGGLYGKGWLNGTQSHLDFLPERSTDFIFAVFCEEFGLMGVLLLLGVYLFIIGRGLYIAINAQDTFCKLLAGGLILSFFTYIFVNMGMVTGQLPIVGIPLPLISLGGTSMVTIIISFGILMAINTHRRFLSL